MKLSSGKHLPVLLLITDHMDSIVLSLGSNIGDRHAHLDEAVQELERLEVRVLQRSSIYESEPVGFTGQDEFLNQVLIVGTDKTPSELLETCFEVERHMGRIRTIKNGPRTIDVDILFYRDEILSLDQLLLPHPRIADRRFILEPLAELIPDQSHPMLDQSVSEMLEDCEDDHLVEKSA